ncbi:MAG: FtsX-like permease family protein [Gammaproteobacteria bacterium]|jgi:putative ABC transport system permease protein|nr:FtsX-like permease family protein [Gammaproteobacteria bacterium]
MGTLHLIRKNLGRKKLRTTFTLLSIAIAFVLFTLLSGINQAFNAGLELAGADRLITMHRMSFIQPIPISYHRRIEAMDGVEAVGHFTWFGAYFQNPRQQFSLQPTELSGLTDLYPEYQIPEDQWQRLMNNQTGLLVGQGLLDAYGWELGQQVPLNSTIFPKSDGSYAWPFQIEAVFTQESTANEIQAFMHWDYFNEARAFGQDQVGWIVTRIADPDQSAEIAARIDERFANSPTETKTSSEQGWTASFAAQFGNIGLIVQSILACVFFTLLLIAGNTMAQAIRERTGELAVMKTIGFPDSRIVAMVLGESVLLAVVGGLAGIGLGVLFVQGAAASLTQFLPGLAVTGSAVATGLVLAVLLGLLTGLVPAWQAGRLRVVEAMGRR